MADLGAIGTQLGPMGESVVYDITWAWDITQNPPNTPICLSAFSVAKPKKEQWKQISGIVTDDTGAPAAREVRAIERRTRQLLATTISNASTGAYAILVPVGSDVEVQRIVLDDDAGALQNDLVDRVYPG